MDSPPLPFRAHSKIFTLMISRRYNRAHGNYRDSTLHEIELSPLKGRHQSVSNHLTLRLIRMTQQNDE